MGRYHQPQKNQPDALKSRQQCKRVGSIRQHKSRQQQAAQGSIYNPIIYYMSLIILDNIIYYNKKYPLARQVFF
jgi:hypothetical protein